MLVRLHPGYLAIDDRLVVLCYAQGAKLHWCDFFEGEDWLLELIKAPLRVTESFTLPRDPPDTRRPL